MWELNLTEYELKYEFKEIWEIRKMDSNEFELRENKMVNWMTKILATNWCFLLFLIPLFYVQDGIVNLLSWTLLNGHECVKFSTAFAMVWKFRKCYLSCSSKVIETTHQHHWNFPVSRTWNELRLFEIFIRFVFWIYHKKLLIEKKAVKFKLIGKA